MFRNLAVLSIYSTFEACNRSYDIKQILNSKRMFFCARSAHDSTPAPRHDSTTSRSDDRARSGATA